MKLKKCDEAESAANENLEDVLGNVIKSFENPVDA